MGETTGRGVEAACLYRTVGIPVVEGLAGFHRGGYAEAVESLLQVRFGRWLIGGSHAQRDVVDWTLTEAAVRAGQRDVGDPSASAPNRRFLRRAEDLAG